MKKIIVSCFERIIFDFFKETIKMCKEDHSVEITHTHSLTETKEKISPDVDLLILDPYVDLTKEGKKEEMIDFINSLKNTKTNVLCIAQEEPAIIKIIADSDSRFVTFGNSKEIKQILKNVLGINKEFAL